MDTMRRDRLSVYGYERPTSPRLEEFAEKAQVYEDAWSVSPWTPPSHASMFTGLLPAKHGVGGITAEAPFPEGVVTLPRELSKAGYRTAGFPANPHLMARGWKRNFHVYLPPEFTGNHSLVPALNHFFRGATKNELFDRSSEWVFDRARRWWEANGDGPRFLFVNLMDPHFPYEPLTPFYEQFLPGIDRSEAYEHEFRPDPYHADPGLTPWQKNVVGRLYDAETAGMDREIGRFVQWLAERRELDDTLFVVTSDHGERLGERGFLGHHLSMDHYLLQVPLLVRYPTKLETARIARRVQLDGLPGYLLHLVGLEVPDVMAESAMHLKDRSVVVAQHHHPGKTLRDIEAIDSSFHSECYSGDWYWVADERFALSWPATNKHAMPVLTDFVADPEYSRNLVEEYPEVAVRLWAAADALPRVRAVEERAASPEMLRKLRALGYVGAELQPQTPKVVDAERPFEGRGTREACGRQLRGLPSRARRTETVPGVELCLCGQKTSFPACHGRLDRSASE